MSRIPIGLIKEGIKKYGPNTGKFIKDNYKEIVTVVGTVAAGGESIKKHREKKKESNKNEGKMHYRKVRHDHYKTKILTELDSQNRNELFQYILEIEQFIQQIKKEKKESGVKKPIHEKRIKNWNDILIQIKDKMSTKDYLEFIKIYNNPNYQSEYFKGFEGHVEKFRNLNNDKKTGDLLKYIAEITGRPIDQIEKDFSLID